MISVFKTRTLKVPIFGEYTICKKQHFTPFGPLNGEELEDA